MRIQRDDHVVQAAGDPPGPLGHQHRLEAAGPVPRHRQAHRADPGLHRLGDRAIAVVPVAAAAAGPVAVLIAQMRGQLGLQRPLQHRLDQLAEHRPRASQPQPGLRPEMSPLIRLMSCRMTVISWPAGAAWSCPGVDAGGGGEPFAGAEQVIEVGGQVREVGHVGAEVVAAGAAEPDRAVVPAGGDVGRLGAGAVGHGDRADRVAGVLVVQQRAGVTPDPVAVPVELHGRDLVDGAAAAVFADPVVASGDVEVAVVEQLGEHVDRHARIGVPLGAVYLYWTSQNAWQMPVFGTEAREPRKFKISIEERKTLVPALQHVPHLVPDTHEARCGKPRIPACLRPKTQYR